MKQHLRNVLGCGLLLAGAAGPATAQTTGPSSSQSPYLVPKQTGVQYTSILTTTDSAANGYKLCGTPDGIGVFDNGNGTFTMLVNHEFGNTAGATRAHGSTGAFVSKWIINKSTLAVVSGADLMQKIFLWNPATSSYTAYNAAFPSASAAFARFCSGDLAPATAFYNSATGKGTQERIYMNGEENGNEGRAMGHIVTGPNAGNSYELPYLGKFSIENYVASPRRSDTTVLIGMDDATPGQVYIYIGFKTNSGNEIERAGLTNGKLYSVAVNGMLTETSASVPAANTTFTMVDLGQVQNTTGTTLNTNSNNAGVTTFLRPEDGAWDPINPRDFYFATTNAFNSPSRLWRLRFNNPGNLTQGGTITAVLDGTEGQQMFDNITVDNSGHVIIVEDVGGNAHIGKMWQYTIATDSLKQIGAHDSTRFYTGGANFLTIDEEASGPIDAQAVLGPGKFLVDVQAHYGISGQFVEGGQLLQLYNPDTYNSNPEIDLQGNNVSIPDGDTVALTTDNTNLGGANLSSFVTKTYTIKNTGPGPLPITDIFMSGANAGEFTFVGLPALPLTIPSGGSQTISIKFAPAALGTRTAKLNIVSNDIDEMEYDVVLKGTGTTPEINVQGNTVDIADGDLTPGLANNTDFGYVVLSNSQTKTFNIQNNGTGPLTLTGISFGGTNAAEFSLMGAPAFPQTIQPASSINITVKFTPAATGIRNAVLNIGNDDQDEALYDFALQGTGSYATGVSTLNAGNGVKLYPNPTGDAATVALALKKDEQVVVRVLDLQGKEVIAQEKAMKAGEQQVTLNTAALVNGVYYVQVSAGNVTTKIKMVVAH